jgi:hypothetical protein
MQQVGNDLLLFRPREKLDKCMQSGGIPGGQLDRIKLSGLLSGGLCAPGLQ